MDVMYSWFTISSNFTTGMKQLICTALHSQNEYQTSFLGLEWSYHLGNNMNPHDGNIIYKGLVNVRRQAIISISAGL